MLPSCSRQNRRSGRTRMRLAEPAQQIGHRPIQQSRICGAPRLTAAFDPLDDDDGLAMEAKCPVVAPLAELRLEFAQPLALAHVDRRVRQPMITASSRSARPRPGSSARNARSSSSGMTRTPGRRVNALRFTAISDWRPAIVTSSTSGRGASTREGGCFSNKVTIAHARSGCTRRRPRTTSSGKVNATT